MWLEKLKKAIILKEFDTLNLLVNETPNFETTQAREEAFFLLQEAKKLLENERLETLQSMKQLKNTIDFLKSTENSPIPSINLKF